MRIRNLNMHPIEMRIFLFLFLLTAAELSAEGRKSAVESDYETLRTVIVMSVDESILKSTEMGSSLHPIFNKGLPRGTIREHEALVETLKKAGVRVLQVRDLLDDAISRAREHGELQAWIEEIYPDQKDRLLARMSRIDADAVLQRSDQTFYPGKAGEAFDPLFRPLSSMYWSRDFAVSTPKGIIIGNGQNYGRSLENGLARLIFRHARALREFSIVFDAGREGVQLDGGDVIVQDENTLLVGVGQRTDRKAAPLLAARLGMDVIAVAMPPGETPSGMSRQLLHLDSVFNFVDRDKVLAVPYFLEKSYIETNPMLRILATFAAQTDGILAAIPSGRRMADSRQVRQTVDLMPAVGWLTRYKAGSGEEIGMDMKLVDYVRSRGFRVIYAGGERGDLPEEKYVLERAMYELRWQGVNVAQLGPGRVIAYDHNQHTNQALRLAGVAVTTFPGELLSLRNGGPHCLILPLVRRKEWAP